MSEMQRRSDACPNLSPQANETPCRRTAAGRGPVAAHCVSPESIEGNYVFSSGAGVLIRSCRPGAIFLAHGHREHVLIGRWGRGDAPRQNSAEPGTYSALQSEGRRYESRHPPDPQVIFLPAERPFEWEWTYPSRSIHLLIAPGTLRKIAAEISATAGQSEMLLQFCRDDSFVAVLLERLGNEAAGRGYGSPLASDSVINTLCVHLLQNYSARSEKYRPSPPRHEGLASTQKRAALSLIEERLTENVRLHELASAVGLSQCHFARQFKASVGASPHEYQLRRRIERARRILGDSTDATLTQVAFALGFTDESHFRRHFKRIVGITPGRYRQQIKR